MEYKIDYKNVLKSMAEGIIVFDLEGRMVDVNEEFADMLGYTKNELIGKHVDYFSPCKNPEIHIENMKPIENKLRTVGYVKNHETQYIKKDGTVVFAEVKISSLKDDKNKLTGYVTAVWVVTERKSSELKLRESEDFLRKIIINGPEYILVKDKNGKYVVASKSVAEYYGMDLDDLIGKTNFDFVTTGKMSIPDAERIMKSDHEVINSGKKIILEESVTLSDGSKRWFQTTKVPLAWKGVSDYVLGISIEITERKMNFDLLIEKEMELEANNKGLNELNTTMKVLLQQKDKDRLELEKKVLSKIKLLVDPHLEKLDRLCSKPINKNLIEIIKTNLQEIISPFTLKLSSGYINLSASEIQVADFIKQGLRNKEIAEIINISTETVAVHRKNIRKKLGISNTKTNLNTYLKTLK